jgi:thiol-disulfide isomerase/thioredoxin
MTRSRLGLLLAFVAILGALAFLAERATRTSGAGRQDISNANLISPAALYAVSFPDLSGTEKTLGSWQGKVIVLNFWATWCPPCKEEIPAFMRLQQAYRDRGLVFVGLAVDERDKVESYAKAMHINYPLLVGGMNAMELAQRAGNRQGGLPFTVVVDRQGRIVRSYLGPVNDKELTGAFESVLAER